MTGPITSAKRLRFSWLDISGSASGCGTNRRERERGGDWISIRRGESWDFLRRPPSLRPVATRQSTVKPWQQRRGRDPSWMPRWNGQRRRHGPRSYDDVDGGDGCCSLTETTTLRCKRLLCESQMNQPMDWAFRQGKKEGSVLGFHSSQIRFVMTRTQVSTRRRNHRLRRA